MLPVLQLGPFAVQVPGLALLAGLWIGLALSDRHARQFGLEPGQIYNLAFAALIGGAIGARLAYIVSYPVVFASSPLSVFSLNPGLLDAWGGMGGAVLAGTIYAQRKRLPFWQTLDALTPTLAVLSLAAGISHLASGAAFGSPTTYPWGIELWGARRHPAQFYEIAAASLILALVWPGRGLIRPAQPGAYFLSFLAMTSGAVLLLDAFRGDSLLLWGGIRRNQAGAWLALAASLFGLYRLKFRTPLPKESEA